MVSRASRRPHSNSMITGTVCSGSDGRSLRPWTVWCGRVQWFVVVDTVVVVRCVCSLCWIEESMLLWWLSPRCLCVAVVAFPPAFAIAPFFFVETSVDCVDCGALFFAFLLWRRSWCAVVRSGSLPFFFRCFGFPLFTRALVSIGRNTKLKCGRSKVGDCFRTHTTLMCFAIIVWEPAVQWKLIHWLRLDFRALSSRIGVDWPPRSRQNGRPSTDVSVWFTLRIFSTRISRPMFCTIRGLYSLSISVVTFFIYSSINQCDVGHLSQSKCWFRLTSTFLSDSLDQMFGWAEYASGPPMKQPNGKYSLGVNRKWLGFRKGSLCLHSTSSVSKRWLHFVAGDVSQDSGRL